MAKPRIIGGRARGRELDTPRRGTRPSPSRLREALFNMLAFRGPGAFLDLYSGSGAIGLEAASRGWHATCVDLSREAAAVIERNARTLGLDVGVVRGDALEVAARSPGAFEVVFAAPPYPLDLDAIFTAVLTARPARPGGLYVFQHPSTFDYRPERDGQPLEADGRRYGSNALTLVSEGIAG